MQQCNVCGEVYGAEKTCPCPPQEENEPMKRPPKNEKKYLLSLPVDLWERLLVACGNEWGKLAQFIRDAIQEKLDRQP